MSGRQQMECGAEIAFPEGECLALLERILSSKEFQRTSRLRDFLTYVVGRKLAGAPHEITEVLIGQRVFGRPAGYNPGEDSIVRTEARNLRLRLERYFNAAGAAEPVILEIPRGGYLPVFRPRDPVVPSPASPAGRTLRPWVFLVASCLLLAALAAAILATSTRRAAEVPPQTSSVRMGQVQLDSSDPRLVQGFDGAKRRSLEYVYTGDPVGDWYESTAGTRYAFCMRDLSHQSTGAAVLGLHSHTLNMLRRFASSISPGRDWCGFWEINKDGFPAPVDYRNDKDFWYCLPANFDLMRACYRQFLWTGDSAYLDSAFSNFYDRTVTSYVESWDRDHDGVMEGRLTPRRRGIPSYYQEDPPPLIGGDMLAAQYTGYMTYAAIQEHKGISGSLSKKLAGQYRSKAQALRIRYNTEWWSPVLNRYFSAFLPNRTFYTEYIADANAFSLLSGITEDGFKTESALDSLEKIRPRFDQALSYAPEILFLYGRNETAYQFLLRLGDPAFPSRGMPEISFAFVGAVATGLMGFYPEAPQGLLETSPHLPSSVAWVNLSHVPVLSNEVSVRHRGVAQSSLTNETGPPLRWKAAFPVSGPGPYKILVDGAPYQASLERRLNGQTSSFVVVKVQPGQTRTAVLRVPGV